MLVHKSPKVSNGRVSTGNCWFRITRLRQQSENQALGSPVGTMTPQGSCNFTFQLVQGFLGDGRNIRCKGELRDHFHGEQSLLNLSWDWEGRNIFYIHGDFGNFRVIKKKAQAFRSINLSAQGIKLLDEGNVPKELFCFFPGIRRRGP